MIKEAYCSFEVAKLLKEKEFCERCFICYEQNGEVFEGFGNWNKTDIYIAAPTHQMACAWLRDVHNIDICVFPYQIDYIGYSYEVKIYKNKEMYFSITDSKTYEEAVEIALKYTLNII